MKTGILLIIATVVSASNFSYVRAQTGNPNHRLTSTNSAEKAHGAGQAWNGSPATDGPVLTTGGQTEARNSEKPRLRITAEGVTWFQYERGALLKEFGQSRTGTYIYDRHGRFDRLEYFDGLTIFARYGDNGELIELHSSRGDSVKFSYHHMASVEVSPTSNAKQFHSAITLLLVQAKERGTGSLQSATVGPSENIPLEHQDYTSDGTPIITIEGTRDDASPDPSPIDLLPIGGTGGGAAGGPKEPPRPHPWNRNPPEYPPDTFTEDYPPFDLPPAACKDWCMRSDQVAHGVCQLIKLPARRALCHERLNGFTANCLRSCDTGDWRWLRGD